MFDFIWGLVVALVEVFLFGGFIISGFKAYEWYFDREIDTKIGGYLGKQKFITVELKVPEGVSLSISEMETIFIESHSISGNRSVQEILSSGKWFFQINFDIISTGGEIHTYLHMEESRLELTRTFVLKHYPNLEFIQCEDPYKSWPRQWWDEDGVNGMHGYRGADIVPVDDLYPVRSWNTFYGKDGLLISDPMSSLLAYMHTIPKDTVMVMQYIMRPWDIKPDKKKSWNAKLQKIRHEFLTNSIVEKKGTMIQALTREEEEVLNSIQVKMQKPQYRLKMRWLVLYKNKPKDVLDDGIASKAVASYLREYKTGMQNLFQAGSTNTDKKYDGGKFGPFDGVLGNWLNNIYWGGSEKEYRMRKFYTAVIGRSLDKGMSSNDFLMDTESIASLLHFPESKMRIATLSPVYGNHRRGVGQQYEDQQVVIQQYQPAFYLQQDGTPVPINSPELQPSQPQPVYNQAQSEYTKPQEYHTNSQQYPQYQNQTQQNYSPNIAQPQQNQTQGINKFKPPDNLPT